MLDPNEEDDRTLEWDSEQRGARAKQARTAQQIPGPDFRRVVAWLVVGLATVSVIGSLGGIGLVMWRTLTMELAESGTTYAVVGIFIIVAILAGLALATMLNRDV